MKFSKLICMAAIASALSVSVWGQAAPAAQGPQWKDQAEFDLYSVIVKPETTPAKRLETLNTWKEKYPETAFTPQRQLLYMQTYAQLQQNPQAIEAAKQVLAGNPSEFNALYLITSLTPALNDMSAGALETGEKAAQGVISNLGTTFDPSKKPAATPDAAWTQAKTDSEIVAHKTLAWVATARKQPAAAQEEYKKALALNPNDASTAYLLGLSIQGEKNPKRTPEVLYYYARSAGITGPGALNPAGVKQIDDFLTVAYKNYHGSATGLDELKNLAKSNAVPPPDFTIESKADIFKKEQAKEEEEAAKDPQLAMFKKVKAALMAADAAQYFDAGVKGSAFPKMKGKLVSQTPAIKPKTLVLAVSDSTTPEVTLNLSAPMAGKAEAGTVLEFEGVPASFTGNPFMLTMDVDKEKISGWPAQAAPAVRKAPVGAKGAVKKKK